MYALAYDDPTSPDLVINTSCEHLPDVRGWLDRLPAGMPVVLQSNDYFAEPEHTNCVASLELPAGQEALVEAVCALGVPVVVVVFAGRPVTLTRVAPHKGEAHHHPRHRIHHGAERSIRPDVEVDAVLDPGPAARRAEGVGMVEARHRPGDGLVHEPVARNAVHQPDGPGALHRPQAVAELEDRSGAWRCGPSTAQRATPAAAARRALV